MRVFTLRCLLGGLARRTSSFAAVLIALLAIQLRTVARVGPTSMRKPLSRPERDDRRTCQTSIRRHPWWRSTMREYADAPIQHRGVAMRHVGPRDATRLTLSTSTASSPLVLRAPNRGRGGDQH